MHEMSLALAVVDQVEEAAREHGAGSVVSVRLSVGELAGVVPEALAFCFELACAGTLLEGAELTAATVPARAHCAPCDREWAVGMPPDLCCPGCRAPAQELLSGRDLRIAEVHWGDPAVPPGAPGSAAGPRHPVHEES